MHKVFLSILNKLDSNEENKISIPELGIEAIVDDKITTALLLLPIFKQSETDEINFKEKSFNKNKILSVIKTFEMMDNLQVDYIGFLGEKSEEAYEHFIKKWENSIVSNNNLRLIREKGQIYIPIFRKRFDVDDLKALSTLGVTVMLLSLKKSIIYINGYQASYSPFDSVPFINFVNSMDYFIDEFLLGELLYYMSTIDDDLKDIIINNIDSVFVKSLSNMFNDPYFSTRSRLYGLDNKDQFTDLMGILKTFEFNRIKDLQFSFVRSYLYNEN